MDLTISTVHTEEIQQKSRNTIKIQAITADYNQLLGIIRRIVSTGAYFPPSTTSSQNVMHLACI